MLILVSVCVTLHDPDMFALLIQHIDLLIVLGGGGGGRWGDCVVVDD